MADELFHEELDALREQIKSLQTELAELRAAGKHWVKLSRAPIGKYGGPAVLAARDRFAAALGEVNE